LSCKARIDNEFKILEDAFRDKCNHLKSSLFEELATLAAHLSTSVDDHLSEVGNKDKATDSSTVNVTVGTITNTPLVAMSLVRDTLLEFEQNTVVETQKVNDGIIELEQDTELEASKFHAVDIFPSSSDDEQPILLNAEKKPRYPINQSVEDLVNNVTEKSKESYHKEKVTYFKASCTG